MQPVTLSIAFMAVVLAGVVMSRGADRRGELHEPPAQIKDTTTREAFFTSGIIPRIKIELDADAIRSLRDTPRKNVKATVRAGDTVYRDVAVHLKGETSFEPIDQKPSLTLNFDKFVSGQVFHGLDKVHLNNSTQDPSLLCEYLGSALFRAAGYPAAQISHARVEMNDRVLGLYVLVEGYNKNFLRRHFKNANGNFYDGGSGQDINNPLDKTSGNGPDDHSDLKALKEAVYERDRAKRLQKLTQVLSVPEHHFLSREDTGKGHSPSWGPGSTPSFYTFMATEILASHWDGYSLHRNNYRLYHDPESQPIGGASYTSPAPPFGGASYTSPSGPFVFIPSGMDQLFVYSRSPLLPDSAGRVAATVLDTAEGRRLLRQRQKELANAVFRKDKIFTILDKAAARLAPFIKELGPKTETAHQQAVTALRRRIDERINFLEAEIARKPLALQLGSNGSALVTDWVPHVNFGMATLYETNAAGSFNALLVIDCRGREMPTIASWRARVSLPKGRYRLEGRLTTSRLRPLPNAPGGGTAIRVFGDAPPTAPVPVDGWQKFSTEFSASTDKEEREIICEARVPGRLLL